MISPNWDAFKAKFGAAANYYFEWLCYLLFCKEFDQKKGLNRYLNQRDTEAEPIIYNDECIGFQAKFYENNSLSSHKQDFINCIANVSKNYPKLYLIFYV